MGLCGGKAMSEEERAEKKKNEVLKRALKEEEEQDQALVKLLLLGAGESGKSTIFKQMRVLYGDGFNEAARMQCANVILSNLLSGTNTVLENCERLGFALTEEAELKAKAVVEANTANDEHFISEEIYQAIKTLWESDNFQKCHDNRSEYQLFDCYKDYAKDCVRKKMVPTQDGDANSPKVEWGREGWIPSVSDVTKARVRTSGIVEEEYNIDGVDFRMYDVGGQRNERKKWIHCFEGVTAVIFVGAISEYDQVLYEDKTQNRLVEAVDLFDEICNSRWFISTSIILFLNKRDLFEEKYLVHKVPLNVTGLPFFEDAPLGEPDWGLATAWVVDKFMERKKNLDKEVYHHITCATDTENVSTVFNACKDIILKGNLKGSGFLE